MRVNTSALLVLTAAIGTAVAVSAVQAQNNGPNVATDPTVVTADTPIARTAAALLLAQTGQDQGDPLMIVAAARALLAVGAMPGDDAPAGTGEVGTGRVDDAKPATGETRADGEATDLIDRLLAEATELANGNATVLAAIADTEALGATRNNMNGPHWHSFSLGSRQYIEYPETYLAVTYSQAVIYGDGYSDVDLYVYDMYDNLICSSTSTGAYESCTWTTLLTGPFYIVVENYGYGWTAVDLFVN